MGFVKKTWKDRVVEFAGRRTLTNTTTNAAVTYDVTRAEGTVSEEGDAFNAANMNDLETRTYNALNLMNKTFTNINVASSAWSTYTASLTNESQFVNDYKYKADITLEGCTANHYALVSLSPEQTATGVYAPYYNTQAGKLRIYANAIPASNITIPSIALISKGV